MLLLIIALLGKSDELSHANVVAEADLRERSVQLQEES